MSYSLDVVEQELKSNHYPFIGVAIQHNNYIYPLIIVQGQENDFIELLKNCSLNIKDLSFGFDCGNIINELLLLNVSFTKNSKKYSLTDNQLSEILFSLTDEELSMLGLIINKSKATNSNSQSSTSDFNYQNIPWLDLKEIINNMTDYKLNQLGYYRKINNE